ncbi:MAG: hypothetical protein IJ274_00630 [Lachnospiraceae bacterium]|nr:hypothetical protein [Lachnospiraceae bacterium]
MTLKEQLQYLTEEVLKGTYDVQTFCDEFIRIYNFEEGYEQLSQKEKILYGELCKMAGRFSGVAEELEGVNIYYNEKEILDKVKDIKSQIEG